MLNEKDKELLQTCTDLVAELLAAAQNDKGRARKYVKARGKIEQAMKLLGEGMRKPIERPQSVGLPVHQKRTEPEGRIFEPPGDVLADNLEEPTTKKRRRNGKDNAIGFSDAV